MIHGEAWKLASENEAVADMVQRLRTEADGRNDILVAAGGQAAGAWLDRPSPDTTELLVAALLIRACHALTFDELLPRLDQGLTRARQPPHTAP